MNAHSKLGFAFLGASGAVGFEALTAVLAHDGVAHVVSFGRRHIEGKEQQPITQHKMDVLQAGSYDGKLDGCHTAICTLGVGQPSKISREDFVKIDKDAVLLFAAACKAEGVKHFELLSSVGIDAASLNFFLRTKGELVEELKAIAFDRLSIFQPSMILTPTNRYGFSQAIVLKVWPRLNRLLIGPLRKYRGVKVRVLGKSMALHAFTEGEGLEYLQWDDFQRLAR